jgi:membrane-associated phospholipid phosphatase
MSDPLILLADAFLILSHPVTVAALFVAGFMYHDRTTWGIAIMLAGFSMMLNPALKEYFAMARPLGQEGYGFPSGHFQGSMCFYGWLFLMLPNKWIKLAIGFLLAGIGFGLVYKGYHYPRDIAGSFVTGSLIVLGTYALFKREPFASKPPLVGWVFLGIGIFPLAYMHFMSGMQKHSLLGLAVIAGVMYIWMRFFPETKERV